MTFSPLMKPPKYYKKPKPETMKKNRQTYQKLYTDEIKWMKNNLKTIQDNNKFLFDMYMILVTGSRKLTPKMESAIMNTIERCKNSPVYDSKLREEADEKLEPILKKIEMVLAMAEQKKDGAVEFIKNVKNYVKKNHMITKKQMAALNKVYKRCTEDLFGKDEK